MLCLAAAIALAACGDAKKPAPALSATAEAAPGADAVGSTEASASASAPAVEASAAPDEVPPDPGGPLVTLDGASRPLPVVPPDRPRLAARGMLVPVHERPTSSSKTLGWLRAGAIVAMRSTDDAGHAGCRGGWRAIEPAGFVCLGDDATLDLDDPIVRATARRPDHTQKLPYMYGTVTRGGPAYGRIPSQAELDELEPNLDKHIAKWKADEESGATYGLDVWAKWSKDPLVPALDAWARKLSDPEERIPFYLRGGGRVPPLTRLIAKAGDAVKIDQVDRRQGVAFIDTFLHEGRRYNVATDLRVIPADRFRPIHGSDHVGVRIGVDVEMPFALVRRPGGKRMRFVGEGKKRKAKAAGELAYRAALPLTGKQEFIDRILHYETKDGDWVSDRYASRIDPARRMPKWGKNGEKWIDVNITKQVLVAYEGEKPVYATIVSTGEAGLESHENTTATKKGIFRVHTKFVTTTMDSETAGEEFELRDVPYVQYFEEGYALHGAYWHDRFGQPKSHGCINLSPEDARRLFFWTEPPVPPGWHGAARALTGTTIFVHP
jgi:lipoprotein-anchoring transpeptidase ErfK/SrfK